MERAGLPTAHITAMTPVAVMGGSPRIVQGKEIVSPWGRSEADAEIEKAIRREIAAEALKSLQTDAEEVVSQPDVA
jgi:glycine/betaine/sarcosine/D-proline reductase family selenoprotein B